MTHEEAEEACRDMGEGFRLPSLQELVSLVQEPPTDEGYISAVFFDQNREWLWSGESRGRVALGDVLGTGLFDYEEAERSAGWVRELQGVHTPETESYGLSSFVYRSPRPF